MIRKVIFAGALVTGVVGFMMGCGSSSSPTGPAATTDASISAPAGARVILSEGFGGDLSKWQPLYMINIGDNYPQMRITTDAFHTGTHSITSDSNRSALVFNLPDRAEDSVVCAQFYFMTKAAGHINFTVEIGQNAGSSGGLGKAFGLGFDSTNNVKSTYWDMFTGQNDTMLGAIQPNKWYKGLVEFNWNTSTITYYLDDAVVRTVPFPTSDMMGIDRLLVFRGINGVDGPKQYYIDDIILYKKK
jgi:hypothetical protein